MITLKQKLKLIKSCFGEYKLSASGNNASVVCVHCLNSGKITKKKKLSIDLKNGIYHCWVCESKGRNVGNLALKYSRETTAGSILKKVYTKDTDPKVEIEKIIRLPEDFKLLYNLKKSKIFKKHYSYLVKRGYDSEKMAKFRIGVSNEAQYRNRVIFPSFDPDQNLNYFITRTIDPKVSFNFRYKNADRKRKDIIFRHSDIDFSRRLILVEGVFDLVNCPDNSTCLLGSWLSEDYSIFKEIVKNKTPVILCLDPDAISKSMKIAELLSKYCIDVKISQNKKEDFGDMSCEKVNYYLATAKRYDNVSRIGYLIDEIHSGSIY